MSKFYLLKKEIVVLNQENSYVASVKDDKLAFLEDIERYSGRFFQNDNGTLVVSNNSAEKIVILLKNGKISKINVTNPGNDDISCEFSGKMFVAFKTKDAMDFCIMLAYRSGEKLKSLVLSLANYNEVKDFENLVSECKAVLSKNQVKQIVEMLVNGFDDSSHILDSTM